jgi:hypothetical protein
MQHHHLPSQFFRGQDPPKRPWSRLVCDHRRNQHSYRKPLRAFINLAVSRHRSVHSEHNRLEPVLLEASDQLLRSRAIPIHVQLSAKGRVSERAVLDRKPSSKTSIPVRAYLKNEILIRPFDRHDFLDRTASIVRDLVTEH